ncbi:hypothetical protein GCM10010377_22610 [Streptomyces viridiviolaceus]|uniref:DUF2690 domain-containing protein n=1 Tax=Streptomyces viridiviolaceus TaxID=68282 RepID=A0ABW2DR61_9ACTN|nr:DUF2690 domain-containing protein [Streptomyces viridiviolaceus]GHB31854.1 hypothetical protein GCM10010377_22610 [Streptomyces viridiviolaceus]
MSARRSAFSALATVVLASTMLSTPAMSAEAAAPAACRNAACTGKNPQTEGCGSGARVLDRIRPAGGGPEVQLRNSARCSAAWARIEKADSSWRFKIQIRGGASYTANASPSYAAYTRMVGSSNAYRACVEEYDGQGGSWSCTKWH